MTCVVFGPGLVGSFLGAAAGAALAIPGPSRAVRGGLVQLAGSIRRWAPRLIAAADAPSRLPFLVATRIPDTPWATLPSAALAAQNGLGQPRPVITCFFGLDVDADGVLRAAGPPPRVVLARPPRAWEGILAAWTSAGIVVEVRDDARPAQWEKAILNATVGPLCLATGLAMREVWSDPVLRRLVLAATREGGRVAAACGATCERGLMGRAERFFSLVGDHRPSLLDDAGELPWIIGPLVSEARRHGLRVPALERIAGMVARATATRSLAG